MKPLNQSENWETVTKSCENALNQQVFVSAHHLMMILITVQNAQYHTGADICVLESALSC